MKVNIVQGNNLFEHDDPTPCNTKIKGKHVRFSFQNTDMRLEVSAEDHKMADLF